MGAMPSNGFSSKFDYHLLQWSESIFEEAFFLKPLFLNSSFLSKVHENKNATSSRIGKTKINKFVFVILGSIYDIQWTLGGAYWHSLDHYFGGFHYELRSYINFDLNPGKKTILLFTVVCILVRMKYFPRNP